VTARLYLIAVDTVEPIREWTDKRLKGGAIHVEELAVARRMEGDELGAILDELATMIAYPGDDGPLPTPLNDPAPYRMPEPALPMYGDEDPDAWRSEVG
jgi:hypothetical protein